MTLHIEPQVLADRIARRQQPAILDVRSGLEFRRGHVPGAVHVPWWLLPFRTSRLPFTREEPIVVYCGHGPRAWAAGAALRRQGYRQVHYLKGHMAGWRRGGFPRTGRPIPSPRSSE